MLLLEFQHPAARQHKSLHATGIIIIANNVIIVTTMTMIVRMDAERKAKEMAVLVADLQRMRSETARNAVRIILIKMSTHGSED